MRRFVGDRLVLATHNAGKKVEIRRVACALGRERGFGGRVGPARTRRDRNDICGQCADQGAFRGQGLGSARFVGRFAASSSTLWTALPAFILPIGPKPRAGRDFALAMAKTWVMLQGKTGPFTRRAASTRPFALPGPTAMTRFSRAAVAGTWSGRRAGETALAMTRCSCPTATPDLWRDGPRGESTGSATGPCLRQAAAGR